MRQNFKQRKKLQMTNKQLLNAMKKTVQEKYTQENINKMVYQANHEASKQNKTSPELSKEFIKGAKVGMEVSKDAFLKTIEFYEKLL